MLACTFSLLAEAPRLEPTDATADRVDAAEGTIGGAHRLQPDPPPPELADLLDHLARSLPLETPT